MVIIQPNGNKWEMLLFKCNCTFVKSEDFTNCVLKAELEHSP